MCEFEEKRRNNVKYVLETAQICTGSIGAGDYKANTIHNHGLPTTIASIDEVFPLLSVISNFIIDANPHLKYNDEMDKLNVGEIPYLLNNHSDFIETGIGWLAGRITIISAHTKFDWVKQ